MSGQGVRFEVILSGYMYDPRNPAHQRLAQAPPTLSKLRACSASNLRTLTPSPTSHCLFRKQVQFDTKDNCYTAPIQTMASENEDIALTAAYKSPDNGRFTIEKHIPAPPSISSQDKSKYLEALRKAVTETQEQVNKELTARMEEDKAREATSNGGGVAAKLGTDEDKEEENYGEEVQEEED